MAASITTRIFGTNTGKNVEVSSQKVISNTGEKIQTVTYKKVTQNGESSHQMDKFQKAYIKVPQNNKINFKKRIQKALIDSCLFLLYNRKKVSKWSCVSSKDAHTIPLLRS